MIKENIIFALRLNVRLNKAHQKHPAEILINRYSIYFVRRFMKYLFKNIIILRIIRFNT